MCSVILKRNKSFIPRGSVCLLRAIQELTGKNCQKEQNFQFLPVIGVRGREAGQCQTSPALSLGGALLPVYVQVTWVLFTQLLISVTSGEA